MEDMNEETGKKSAELPDAEEDRDSEHPDVLACRKSFETYYEKQIGHTFRVSVEDGDDAGEWVTFLEYLRKPLPVTFRTNRMKSYRGIVEKCMSEGRPILKAVGAIQRAWCANSWELPCDRRVLRERGTPALNDMHKWMRKNERLGAISRQEIVSMIPVLFLDVLPHHVCLDMCAAPGSKTTQLLEIVRSRDTIEHSRRRGIGDAASPAIGMVVANDFNTRRAAILAHRCRKRVDTCDRLMVVNHKAQMLPWFTEARHDGDERYPAGRFDRIVCDVPCTGDGAIRKVTELWRYWQPHLGIELHSLQLQIAMRAAALLRVGGLMAYSTCSLNPIENEAVVAALLRQTGGALELVDSSGVVPEFKRRPGLTTWHVMDDKLDPYSSYEQTQRRSRRVPKRIRNRFRRSMFPPPTPVPTLRRCMRLYPHLQNTGGFFIAILRKTKPIPGPRVTMSRKRPRSCVIDDSAPKKKEKTSASKTFFRVPKLVGTSAATSAGLDGEAFWSFAGDCLFSRSSAYRRMYYVAKPLQDLCIDGPASRKLRPVFSGVLLLEKRKRKTV
eukprot:g5161.t1